MTISISNLTINNNAPAGTVLGVLTAQDASGTIIPCNFTLTKKLRRILCYLREQPSYSSGVDFGRQLFGTGSRHWHDHQVRRQRRLSHYS
jgi:hypothetical protein